MMIWATVSSWSCFCWLYRASPSSVAENVVSLIWVLTIWWCPCEELSLALSEKGVCYAQCVILTRLTYPLPCFILYPKFKLACYSRYLLTSYFCIPVPYDEKWHFVVVVSSRRSCRSPENCSTSASSVLLWITINCGKFWKRWEYQTTWPASWEIYMHVRKQELELDMEQQTGSK